VLKFKVIKFGGEGSGNIGHSGLKGTWGGSGSKGSGSEKQTTTRGITLPKAIEVDKKFKGSIKFTAPNKLNTQIYEYILEFEIVKPGTWDMNIII